METAATKDDMLLVSAKGRAGLYVHVPFCLRKCRYCDFTIAVQSEPPHIAYADAVVTEFADRSPTWTSRSFQTLYVGGGTPSLWSEEAVDTFVSGLELPWETLREWTVEFNPECVTSSTVNRWVSRGANRISLGVQSLHSDTLSWLGRMHDAADVRRSLDIIEKSGVPHVSVDLIYGVPGRSSDVLRRELESIVHSQSIDHVSAYELTWETNTPLDAARLRGTTRPKDEDSVIEEYQLIHEVLLDAGFEHYEVSSYARPGGRAIHNSAYWDGTPYLGLGVGAHSLTIEADKAIVRTANVRSLKRYLRDGHSFEETETVDWQQHAVELAMLGLRTADGIEFRELCERFSMDRTVMDSLIRLARSWQLKGWGRVRDARFSPNDTGLLQCDLMAAEAMEIILGTDERPAC